MATTWVALERRCCPLLDIVFGFPTDQEQFTIAVGGAKVPDGFVAQVFPDWLAAASGTVCDAGGAHVAGT